MTHVVLFVAKWGSPTKMTHIGELSMVENPILHGLHERIPLDLVVITGVEGGRNDQVRGFEKKLLLLIQNGYLPQK